jgi:hypothetical protein
LKIFLGLESQLRDRPFYLKGGWGGYGFLFRSEFFFRTKLEYFFFFPEFNIRLYVKTLNQIIFFFLHRNHNIFFSNIWNQNIFLEKKHNPPLQVKWSFPYELFELTRIYSYPPFCWFLFYFYFYNIRGRLQLTADSANYVGYWASRSKEITNLL